ncbi:hypothetical protein LTR47_009493 [Exophiala xenobiotica]|nr:hypothetical protein LTR92_007358 [Exophiala xenobiotica]KAK5212174.1 hypothetical protein LTR41_002416 [Exophiala xenobiotica]KAK5225240.1 hypothetical protein LTR47_009493 [Exophiala xenobiotica]KAK5280664.1 hypothetical protein LTR40_006016 [Exophiala xenobiotica]KAK5346872.1 hypothetical protein LTR61_009313 [Exophiala xenobiotica]
MASRSPPSSDSRGWWKLKSKRPETIPGPGPGDPLSPSSKKLPSNGPRTHGHDRGNHRQQLPYDDSSQQIPLQAQPTYVKQEPSSEFNRLSLTDPSRSNIPSSDPMRRFKRPAHDQDSCWPNKKDDRGSASPYSARHEQALSHAPSPPLGSTRTPTPSAAYQSAQKTPLSSPKLASQVPASDPRSYSRQSFHQPEAEKPSVYSVARTQDGPLEEESKMLLQPETRPISQEQLVNEVKGIYAGLVMVEKKCVEICQQQSQTTTKLSNEQWQALIALHRTLLHEHHDFFLASQHPTASPALRRLPTKYAMPARMWRHGIHSFLELLRHRLPYSLEHMLSFVYLAYQMMGLLMESVPTFHETWIECLGDLARYRMAIEEADMRDRENWSNVARMWYNRAADRSPTTGRIQHHLAVLARPNVVRQLFYYTKALISGVPFVNARDSIMLLFTPFLEKFEVTSQKYPKMETSLVTAAGILFTRGSIHDYCGHVTHYVSELDGTISRTGSNFKVQGAEVASSLIAMVLDFGSEENFLWKAFCANSERMKQSHTEGQTDLPTDTVQVEDPILKARIQQKFWVENGPINPEDFTQVAPPAGDRLGVKFGSSDEITSYTLPVWHTCFSVVAGKVGDRNILPFLHFTLAFLWSLSYVPGALVYLENYVPWTKLVLSLNSMNRSGVVDARVESRDFPQQQSGTGRQLPEDFLLRGFKYSSYYFPNDFFEGQVVDEDDRTLELPSHAAPRAERCLWLGVRLASLKRYITYDIVSKEFACTEFASALPDVSLMNTLQVAAPTNTQQDSPMVDVV